MMRRAFFASIFVVGVIGSVAAAEAAMLTIESNATSYGVGDTITITITADSEGEIEPDDYIRVIVAHDLSKVSANGAIASPQLFTQFDGAFPAVTLNDGVCAWAVGRDDQCLAFQQGINFSGFPVDPGPTSVVFTYTAEAAGTASFLFQDLLGPDFNFFSLGDVVDVGTAPAGLSVTIVPEPSTAVLLVLGLSGFAMRRR